MVPGVIRELNIRTRLLLLCLAVSTPLLIMCGFIIWREYQGLMATAQKATRFHDAIAVRAVSQWIKTQKNELQALSFLPEMQRGNRQELETLLTGQQKVTPDWQAIVLVDKKGKFIAHSGLVAPTLLPGDFVDALFRTKRSQVSGVCHCPISGQECILIGVPVNAGNMQSALVAAVKSEAVKDLFSDLGEDQGAVICVVDRDNRVVTRTLDHDRWVGKDFSHAKTVTAASKVRTGTIEVVGIADPTPRTYAFDRVPETDWLVVVGIPVHILYGPAHDRLLIMIVCALLSVGASVLLAYAFTTHFTGPIHELVKEALAIGRGDLSKRARIKDGGELGLLARAFNQMAVNLELNREHRSMVERISDSIRQSLDLDQILNTTVLELGQALSASRCCLALINAPSADDLVGKQLEFNYVWWDEKRGGTALKNHSVMITEESILKIILDQGAILSLDVMDQSGFLTSFERAEASPEDWTSIKSLIACPILLNRRPIGLILVHECSRRRAWLELELELVQTVAGHVAIAMEHAGLFAKTRTLAEQEFLINHIVRAVRASLDTDTILSTVTEELCKALSLDYCQIAQPSPDAPLVITHEYHASGLDSRKGLSLYGTKLDFNPDTEYQELKTVLGIDLAALNELRATGLVKELPMAVMPSVVSDKRAGAFKEFIDAMGTRSLIAAPLLRDDRVLGILIGHQCRSERDWQTGEVRLLSAVADQLAVAISHAQYFAQVKHQAITDGLTGLYNHIYFKNRLAEELNRAQRKSTTCSLLMVDLDKLKQINDTMGHPIGDAAIRQVAAALKSHLRSGDTAARYGGEEFAVILPETPVHEAVIIADRLRRAINRTPVPGLGHISASMGAATFPQQGATLEDLIDKADKALYVAKRSGRNRVAVWDDAQPRIVAADESPLKVDEDRKVAAKPIVAAIEGLKKEAEIAGS